MDLLGAIFPDDPNVPNDKEAATHVYVAGIVAAAFLFLIAVKAGMKSAAI